jgi:hypothetical protein
LLGMILVTAVALVSESCCLSDGGAQLCGRGGAGRPEFVPSAAGVLAAPGDDAGGAVVVRCMLTVWRPGPGRCVRFQP